MDRRDTHRPTMRLLTLVVVLLVAVGCGTTVPAPTSGGPTATASGPESALPTESPPSLDVASRAVWQPAGSPPGGNAVVLADGRVLVLSGADAVLWDADRGWRPTESLNAPRAAAGLVALHDGRALVVGGIHPGDASRGPVWPCDSASYSSSYVFDPGAEHWSKTGLLDMARTAPAVAVLADGRVLAAGGFFFQADNLFCKQSVVDLVAYRPGSMERSPIRLDDMDPGTWGSPLATAELFDPAASTWSSTGHLVYARQDAEAVTLRDGRVLVADAEGSAELYDPATGRFVLTGSLPPIDRAALAQLGIKIPDEGPDWPYMGSGSLVALDDGGALLVGLPLSWKHRADVVRTLRFDARVGTWSELGMPYAAGNDGTAEWAETSTPDRTGALVAKLLDGRILVAGGQGEPTRAELYDPAADRWVALGPMPTGRIGGTAVALRDGSILLLGGDVGGDGTPPGSGSTATRLVIQP